LAGDVVSWMRDKRLEHWLQLERAKEILHIEGEVREDVKEDAGIHPTPNVDLEDGEIKADSFISMPNADLEAESTGTPRVNGDDRPLGASLSPSAKRRHPVASSSSTRFPSAGTVIVRAMQSRPGSGNDGWLEEGSVLCFEDRRVLGTVSLTLTFAFSLIQYRSQRYSALSPVHSTKFVSLHLHSLILLQNF